MGIDFFRQAKWLNAGRASGYGWLLALLNIALLAYLVLTSRNGVDRNGYLLGTDFLSFWTAGNMLHAGGNVYDAAAHAAAQQRYFVQDGTYTAFFYPPAFLPVCYALGLLGYFPALATWLLATGSAYAVAVRLWFAKLAPGRYHWTAIAALPPVLIAVTHGQTSFVAAALLGLGALLVPERPVLAGVLLGLATIKPQFGLLVPLVLVLTRQWQVIAVAALSAAALALVATLAFGMAIWRDWLAGMGPATAALESGAIGYAKMQSLFAAAKLMGASSQLAYGLQACLSGIVAIAIGLAAWRQRYGSMLASAMLAGSLLTTPFMLDYDLVLLAFPLIALLGSGFRPWEKLAAALIFIAPVFARPLAEATGVPIMPPLLIALFVVLVRRCLNSPENSRNA